MNPLQEAEAGKGGGATVVSASGQGRHCGRHRGKGAAEAGQRGHEGSVAPPRHHALTPPACRHRPAPSPTCTYSATASDADAAATTAMSLPFIRPPYAHTSQPPYPPVTLPQPLYIRLLLHASLPRSSRSTNPNNNLPPFSFHPRILPSVLS